MAKLARKILQGTVIRMDSVGKRIKEIRLSKGITQADLAVSLDTSTAAISRYELGQRSLRFEQLKIVADVLGVSVFELYGFNNEQQKVLKNYEKFEARIEEQIQHLLAEKSDEATMELVESLRSSANDIRGLLQNHVMIAETAHKAQVQATLMSQPDESKISSPSPKPDLALKRRNKRVDSLISMFNRYPDDTQNRILDVVSTFGQLNGIGQKRAVGRIKELTEIPRYQAGQEEDSEM